MSRARSLALNLRIFQIMTIAFATMLSLQANAAPPSPRSADAAKIPPGSYAIYTPHTFVLFGISDLGFTTSYGQFSGITGTMTVDPAKPEAATLSVTIPVSSISIQNAVLERVLKDAEWLDAQKFPNITFVATKISQTGPNTIDITGDLTLHGVTRPVTLATKFNQVGPNQIDGKLMIGFDATAHLKRSDFGVAKYVPVVGDDVSITISVAFEKP